MSEDQTAMRQVRERQIHSMRLTCEILGNILGKVSDERARRLRDGADGWSIVEIVCHLRDFDEIFQARALMMLEQEGANLPGYDHEAMAIERGYQSESLGDAYDALASSRQRFAAFFESLTAAQWACAGLHPERGPFGMTDALMQVCAHDLDHLEQITRVLRNA